MNAKTARTILALFTLKRLYNIYLAYYLGSLFIIGIIYARLLMTFLLISTLLLRKSTFRLSSP